MKRRNHIFLFFLLLTLVLCLGLCSCGNEDTSSSSDHTTVERTNPTVLSTPTGLAVIDKTLIWEPVTGASGYSILCEGQRYFSEEASLDISSIAKYPNIEFSFTVIAKGDGKKIRDSLSSEPCLYSFSASSEGICFVRPEDRDYYAAYVVDPSKPLGRIYIPGEYDGIPVKEILSGGFENCVGVAEVILHDNIKTIEDYAFSGCSALQSIIFSDSLEKIDSYAFQDCIALKEVQLPASLTNISGIAFMGCSALSTLTVQMENQTFRSEENCLIRRANDELTVYAGDKSGVLPSSVKSIGPYAFYRSSLEHIVLHEGITTIGDYAFSESSVKDPALPSTLTNIKSHAFSYCEGITSLVIGSNVWKIEAYAYYSCPSLSFLSLPGTVHFIGEYAFADLDQITVMISRDVDSMENNVFSGQNMVIYTDYNTEYVDNWPVDWGYSYYIDGGESDPTITWKYRFVPYLANCTFQTDERGALYVTGAKLVFKDTLFDEGPVGGGLSSWNDPTHSDPDDARSPLIYTVGIIDLPEGLAIPVREGYTFLGWALEENGAVIHTVNENGHSMTSDEIALYRALNSTTTLYAVWEKN